MQISLIHIGKTDLEYLRTGIKMFAERIPHYVPFEIVEIPDVKNAKSLSQDQQKDAEGKLILSKLSKADFVVLMDEKGKQYTSRDFAAVIERHKNAATKRLVFVIGGPYGFSQEVYERANSLISLSKMTFSHQMVRLIFVEQLYRACTILAGQPYHHD